MDLTAADDRFHRPATEDPFWTETAWFAFCVPERRLAGALYPVFRANQGVCSCGVYVWDDSAEEPWDVLYARTWWHLPMPEHELTELRLPSGLAYDQLEPLRRYRLRYRDEDEIDLDLEFAGVHDAHPIGLAANHGHLDQVGRVSGSLRLHGEEIAVDCFDIRDRSWAVRADHGAVRAAYDYGVVDGENAFQAVYFFDGREYVAAGGFLLRDGELAGLGRGRRTVTRVDDRPARVVVEGEDALGRRLHAEGVCVNRLSMPASPNYFAWMSLTQWDLDGVAAWGEDQDVWSPDQLRAARRAASALARADLLTD